MVCGVLSPGDSFFVTSCAADEEGRSASNVGGLHSAGTTNTNDSPLLQRRRALEPAEVALVLRRLEGLKRHLEGVVDAMDPGLADAFSEKNIVWEKCIYPASFRSLGIDNASRVMFQSGAWIWITDNAILSVNLGDSVFTKMSSDWTETDKLKLLAACSNDWRHALRERGQRAAVAIGIEPREINWTTLEPRFGPGTGKWARHLVIPIPADEVLARTGFIESVSIEIDECTLTLRSFEVRDREYLKRLE